MISLGVKVRFSLLLGNIFGQIFSPPEVHGTTLIKPEQVYTPPSPPLYLGFLYYFGDILYYMKANLEHLYIIPQVF